MILAASVAVSYGFISASYTRNEPSGSQGSGAAATGGSEAGGGDGFSPSWLGSDEACGVSDGVDDAGFSPGCSTDGISDCDNSSGGILGRSSSKCGTSPFEAGSCTTRGDAGVAGFSFSFSAEEGMKPVARSKVMNCERQRRKIGSGLGVGARSLPTCADHSCSMEANSQSIFSCCRGTISRRGAEAVRSSPWRVNISINCFRIRMRVGRSQVSFCIKSTRCSNRFNNWAGFSSTGLVRSTFFGKVEFRVSP